MSTKKYIKHYTSKTNANANAKYKTKYTPLNLTLSQFRALPYNNETEDALINFLSNKPTKLQLNKLYDTTMYFASYDSIGESWHYVSKDELTRPIFDTSCKLIVNKNEIEKLEKLKKENASLYRDAKSIKIYIDISFDLLHHLGIM